WWGDEVGRALIGERDRLAVDHAVGKLLGRLGDGREFLRPVEALAGAQDRLAILDAQLQAVAVELHLVRPAARRRRALDQLGELGLDELRHRLDLLGPSTRLGEGGRVAPAFLVALPHRAGAALLGGHEWRRRVAGADRDLLQGAAGGDRARVFQ